jgi:hypothetical protein
MGYRPLKEIIFLEETTKVKGKKSLAKQWKRGV